MSEQKVKKQSKNGAFPHKAMTDVQKQVVADALEAGVGCDRAKPIKASISVYSDRGQAWDTNAYANQEELNKRVNEIRTEGYQFTDGNRTVIYTISGIKQIDIVIHEE